MKKITLALCLTFILFTIVGCTTTTGGFQANGYFDTIVGNEQHRELTIVSFKGTSNSSYKIDAADKLYVELEIGSGTMNYKLQDPNGNVIFDEKVSSSDGLIKLEFEGPFDAGQYRGTLRCKDGMFIRVELKFE